MIVKTLGSSPAFWAFSSDSQISAADLCEELGIHATQYSTWQEQLFENGAVACEWRRNQANLRRQKDARENKITQLEEKLQRKNEVVAELLEEHVQLEKALGGT